MPKTEVEELDPFLKQSEEDQRASIANLIGCGENPDGWPNRIIDNLLRIRKTGDIKRFRIALGTVLSPGF